eukprot:5984822-Pyramimonas_sp.AAC.1
MPSRRICYNAQLCFNRDVETFMHPRASSSATATGFSKIQAAGYSSYMRGRDADAGGTFMNEASSARMPV